MCRICETDGIDRRNVLRFAALGLAAFSLAGGSPQAVAASGPATALGPDEALAALKAGNER